MEKHEKWQTLGERMGRLRLKIVLGAVFVVAFLGVMGWIAYRSFSNIVASVKTLSTPRPETGLVNEMITDISEIQAYSGQYSISKDPASLSNYRQKTVKVHELIDTLRNESDSKKYGDKLDTLRLVFDEYVVALDEWILLRAQDADRAEYQMYGLIRSGDSSLKHTSHFLPKAEVTQVTKTVQKPLAEAPPVEAEPEEKPKNRLRNKNNKKNVPVATPVDSVSKETTTTITTVVDSSYLSKVDTLLNQMEKTLNKAKNYRTGLRKKMGERETELQQTELLLMARIRTLLNDIEAEEAELAQAGVNMAQATAERSYRQLIALGIVALLTLLILGITLFSDIAKSIFYRQKLQEAKLEAERLAQVKEEFLANMSHEIRTPINSIIGFTEQLQNTEMHPGKKAKVHAIWRSSNHLLALVNDILDFTKLEAGSLQLEQIGFCYTDVVEEVIEMLETEARKKNIHIVFEPNEASEMMVTGDPVRIKQILLNLVANAVKFTDKGNIHILTEKKQGDETVWITCRVKDSGKGIKPGELNKVFRKFEQEDSSVTRHHGGTGLGLSISKKLTELQNGKIWAESCVDVGSTFSFEIPFAPADKNDYKKIANTVEFVPGLLTGRKIAVVDDDPIVVELLGPIFEESGSKATFFQHPERAWDSLVKDQYDLIIMDLHMPGMDGMELLARIRTAPQNPNRETPVVLCTANVIKNIQHPENEKKPDHVLYKPYKRQDVLYIMHQALGIELPAKKTGIESSKQTRMEAFTLKNFREFAGDDLQLLDNFITLFISESESELQKLDNYLQTRNYRQIGETAHLFKNTYGQLEATAELAIINKLEVLAKEQSITENEIGELILDLQERSKHLFVDLRREMDRLKKEGGQPEDGAVKK